MGIQWSKYMSYLIPANGSGLKYNHLIGTGGIGSGIFFRLFGNSTLGREESRLAELLPGKDYCKLHIVVHYLATLLGAKENNFNIFPIGKIGDDDVGLSLFQEMQSLGINMENVFKLIDTNTLFSVCFQYPDNTGGNITSANSASSIISERDIISFFAGCKIDPKKEIILSLPEVPIAPRLKLLEIGRSRGSLNVGAVSSFEIKEFNKKNGFTLFDLIILNIDEAGTIAKINGHKSSKFIEKLNIDEKVSGILKSCISFLVKNNIDIMVVITNGAGGSYVYSQQTLKFIPVLNVKVKGTSGAGDAFLAGTIAGLSIGLSFNGSAELGSFLASLSVISENTINHDLNLDYMKKFIEKNNIRFGPELDGTFRV